ncbi:MAG TPA: methyltransferase domain-containing protein [Streptosporangiaceae bacterium]|nr:methyltransferase domain-containing protein [Streptosporangiaceae bacterium]
MGQTAAYDAIADWYEEWISGAVSEYSARVHAMLRDLLSTGDGICVDLCCGTGARAAVIRELGWTPAGVDLSQGQLGHAAARLPVLCGSADRLPVATGAVASVACVLHTHRGASLLRRSVRGLERPGKADHR